MPQPLDNLTFLEQLAANCRVDDAVATALKNLKLLCGQCNAVGGVMLQLLYHNEETPQNFSVMARHVRNHRLSERFALQLADFDEKV